MAVNDLSQISLTLRQFTAVACRAMEGSSGAQLGGVEQLPDGALRAVFGKGGGNRDVAQRMTRALTARGAQGVAFGVEEESGRAYVAYNERAPA